MIVNSIFYQNPFLLSILRLWQQDAGLSVKEPNLVVSVQSGQAFRVMFFEEGCLDFLLGDHRFALVVDRISEATAVDDGEILTDEATFLMGRQRDNLEAQLLRDKKHRTQDMIARGLAKRIIRDDRTRIVLGFPDMAALLRKVIETSEEQGHILTPRLTARPFIRFFPRVGPLREDIAARRLAAAYFDGLIPEHDMKHLLRPQPLLERIADLLRILLTEFIVIRIAIKFLCEVVQIGTDGCASRRFLPFRHLDHNDIFRRLAHLDAFPCRELP